MIPVHQVEQSEQEKGFGIFILYPRILDIPSSKESIIPERSMMKQTIICIRKRLSITVQSNIFFFELILDYVSYSVYMGAYCGG